MDHRALGLALFRTALDQSRIAARATSAPAKQRGHARCFAYREKQNIAPVACPRALSCLGMSATVDDVQDRTEINPTLYGVLDSDVGRNGARADAK